jgi:CubicO group peptidase (beta-lactamase class C family)
MRTPPLATFARFAIGALLAAAVSSAAVSSAAGAQAPDLDEFIERGMRDWRIPGLAVAIVHNDSVVYATGFGTRTVGANAPVDARTMFGIMSTTKAMTALAVAMLVDEGKVAWDDPVTKHLPTFRLSNPWVTQEVTVRDLLTHVTGLGNADLLWTRGDLSTRDILTRVARLELAYSLRSDFVYQNVMYQAAGEVVAAASGMPWERFVETRIFAPLGMTRSRATLANVRALNDANVSSAHWDFGGDVRVIDEQPVDPVPAAGSAWSTADDAARWMRFLLDSGRVNGQRLVSEASFRELFRPQVIVPAAQFYPSIALTRPRWMTYGLGWFQQDYRGMHIAMHTGSIAGRTAIVGLVHSQRLGVFFFANTDHEEFRHALMWRVIDRYTGAPYRDWHTDLKKIYDERDARTARAVAARENARVRGTRPSHALEAYTGTFAHPVYATLQVRREEGTLRVNIGPLAQNAGTLEHFHYDTFRARLGDGRHGWTYFTFRTGGDGSVAAVRYRDSAALEFTRSPR